MYSVWTRGLVIRFIGILTKKIFKMMMDDIPYIDYLVYKILSLVANPTNGVSQSIEVLCKRIFSQKKSLIGMRVINFCANMKMRAKYSLN